MANFATLYLIIIVIARIIQSFFNKKNSVILSGDLILYLKHAIYYFAVASVIALFCFFFFIENSFYALTDTWFYGFLCGLGLCLMNVSGMQSLKHNTMVLYNISATSGILIPIITSVFLFGELIGLLQYVSIILLFISCFLLSKSSKQIYKNFNTRSIIFLLVSFFSTGFTLTVQKIFGIYVQQGSVSLFTLISFISAMLFSFIFFIVYKFLKACKKINPTVDINCTTNANQTKIKQYFLPKIIFINGIILGIALFAANYFVTLAVPHVTSILLFAFSKGSNVLIGFIIGATFFKEKITIKSFLGIIVGILAFLLLQL